MIKSIAYMFGCRISCLTVWHHIVFENVLRLKLNKNHFMLDVPRVCVYGSSTHRCRYNMDAGLYIYLSTVWLHLIPRGNSISCPQMFTERSAHRNDGYTLQRKHVDTGTQIEGLCANFLQRIRWKFLKWGNVWYCRSAYHSITAAMHIPGGWGDILTKVSLITIRHAVVPTAEVIQVNYCVISSATSSWDSL